MNTIYKLFLYDNFIILYKLHILYSLVYINFLRHARFPATVIVALQMSMLCAMQYPSTMEDDAMDEVENMLKLMLGWLNLWRV